MTTDKKVAYFSMEIGLGDDMPTYSGGLGVLAGDTLRAAADQSVEMVAVTLVHRKGYFRQQLDIAGKQTEDSDPWPVEERLAEMEPVVDVSISGRRVAIRAFKKELVGDGGSVVPVYFLDCDLPQNDEAARALTDSLYGGDERYRLEQEIVLGIGGVRMLDALGHEVATYHMNEGHAALLALELSERLGKADPDAAEDIVRRVQNLCVFTTHTPVAAGHDRFPADVAEAVLGAERWARVAGSPPKPELNMTELALRHSRYVNGVARRHGEVTREMFDGFEIDAITNGVHAATWAAPSTRALFDRHIPEWRTDNQSLRYLVAAPLDEIREAHREAKQQLIEEIERQRGASFDPECFTIGIARRATAYKRGDMLVSDRERLRRIAAEVGPIQIVYAGKAHPKDTRGKEIIENIVAGGKALEGDVRLVYLSNYSMSLGGLLTAGCDLWLNTPEPPQEASGTSGMKAALNGVPSLSVLDGWWLEGHVEGVTGWAFGGDGDDDAAELYDKLESTILPLYYDDPEGYASVRRYAMALNGAFFNTERMVREYSKLAYDRAGGARPSRRSPEVVAASPDI